MNVASPSSEWVYLKGTDPDGDKLTFRIVIQPTHGTVRQGQDNLYIYTPKDGYEGEDSFTYVAGAAILILPPSI